MALTWPSGRRIKCTDKAEAEGHVTRFSEVIGYDELPLSTVPIY